MAPVKTIGDLLRDWRLRRRLSQLNLACEAEISTRHLSFLETGRSIPSREMVLRLAEQLEVPKRERNVLLVAAGFAPIFPERSLQDPVLHGARKAIDLVLEAQKPCPAFALDRHWNIVASNGGLPQLYVGVSPALLQQPVNALRLGLHPEGLAPKIANLAEWRAHLLARLKRQIDLTGDTKLADLLQEVSNIRAVSARLLRPQARSSMPSWCHCNLGSIPRSYPFSAPPPSLARLSMSPCRNWRWNVFIPPTMPPRKPSARSRGNLRIWAIPPVNAAPPSVSPPKDFGDITSQVIDSALSIGYSWPRQRISTEFFTT